MAVTSYVPLSAYTTSFFRRSDTVVAYGLTMISMRLRGPGVPRPSSASRRSSAGAALTMDVIGTPPDDCGYSAIRACRSARRYTAPPHSSTHQEGWRDMALRNPGNLPQGNGANSIRLQLQQAWEMWNRRFQGLRPQTPAEVFSYAARVSFLQGMSDQLSA